MDSRSRRSRYSTEVLTHMVVDMSDPTKPTDVVTPGGRRPFTSVHHVRQGEQLRVDASGRASIAPQAAQSSDPQRAGGLVLTPGGFRHSSLVHRVAPGQTIDATAHRLRLLSRNSDAVLEVPAVAIHPGEIPGFGSG